MAQQPASSPDGAFAVLDLFVGEMTKVRSCAASVYAAETRFFAALAEVVRERDKERAVRFPEARVTGSQLAMREVYAEIAVALRISEQTVARRVSTACLLIHDFPATFEELNAGRIDPAHAETITGIGMQLDDEHLRGVFETQALGYAHTETPARLRGILGDLVTRLDPEGTEERVKDAVSRRCVRVRDLEPGLARLQLDAPTLQVHGIYNRLTDMAITVVTGNTADGADASTPDTSTPDVSEPGEPLDDRTIDQIRADVVTDLLLAGAPQAHGDTTEARTALGMIRATVHVTIPASTLTGDTTGGAVIDGHGPFDTDTARLLAGLAKTWTRVFTGPASPVPLTVDTYRPSKRMRRYLAARDQRCRFPGCRRPARRCDIDHTIAHSQCGATAICNLAHLCRRHHTLKHHSDWQVEQLPGGILRWTSPTGRIHHDRPPGFPPSGVRFTLDEQPAPF